MSYLNKALFQKYVRESLLLFIFTAIGLFAFAWFRVWIVSEVDTARFQQILDLLPKDWRRFSAVDFDWIISYLGRTSLTLDEPMITMLCALWCIVRGSDVVSGELNRGTMEMVLSQPISRSRVYIQHAVLTVGGLLVLMLLIWLGMAIAVWTTSIDEITYPTFKVPLTSIKIPITYFGPQTETVSMLARVQPIQFLPGIINLFCFGFFITSFSMLFSSWDQFRWRTLGIVVGIYFVQGMLKVGALGSEKLFWMKYLTFFSLYEPALSVEIADTRPEQLFYLLRVDEVGQTIGLSPLSYNLLLLALAIVFFYVGMQIFRKRDLPAPL